MRKKGSQTTLRYVMQLLTPSRIIAETNGRDKICRADVEEAGKLFFHGKQSAQILREQADHYIS